MSLRIGLSNFLLLRLASFRIDNCQSGSLGFEWKNQGEINTPFIYERLNFSVGGGKSKSVSIGKYDICMNSGNMSSGDNGSCILSHSNGMWSIYLRSGQSGTTEVCYVICLDF